jgi:murein DD-endopeptidase MepM/ murein hydrolase activator NlpD
MPRWTHGSAIAVSVAAGLCSLDATAAAAPPIAGPVAAHSVPAIQASKAIAAAQPLLIPVEAVRADQLVDTFNNARAAGRRHDAIDIMAPKGTRVVAAADGTVVKLFTSVRGGLTVYEFDPSSTIEYYYAHLDSYAPGLVEGAKLRRGDPIGFVGSTGDADPGAPHLHFEIAVLGTEKHWWQATDINPYPVLTGKQTLAQSVDAEQDARR